LDSDFSTRFIFRFFWISSFLMFYLIPPCVGLSILPPNPGSAALRLVGALFFRFLRLSTQVLKRLLFCHRDGKYSVSPPFRGFPSAFSRNYSRFLPTFLQQMTFQFSSLIAVGLLLAPFALFIFSAPSQFNARSLRMGPLPWSHFPLNCYSVSSVLGPELNPSDFLRCFSSNVSDCP